MKYLFLLPDEDNYRFFYQDLKKRKDVLVVMPSWKKTKFVEFLHHVHTSKKINKIIKLPFQDLWIKKYKNRKIKNFLKSDKNPVVVVFRHSFFLFYLHSYEKWLKKINQNVKLCFLFTDIVDSFKTGFSIDIARKKFDALISFDKEDCEEYSLRFYPHVITFPAPETTSNQNVNTDYDVYFMGRDKGRLELLLKIYKKLKENNISCLFEIAGSDYKKLPDFCDNDFRYIDFIPYKEYLKRCSKSKCILEIMQSTKHSGYTTRVLEAIYLNKKLISNNILLAKTDIFDSNLVSVFSQENDLDISFIKNQSNICWNYNKSNYSVKSLMNFIDSVLYEK